MPPLTNSNYDSEPESICEESEIFPPRARNCVEVEGEIKTKTKGYSANYFAVGSDVTYVPEDHKTSVTGGVWHSQEGEKHHDRVSVLRPQPRGCLRMTRDRRKFDAARGGG